MSFHAEEPNTKEPFEIICLTKRLCKTLKLVEKIVNAEYNLLISSSLYNFFFFNKVAKTKETVQHYGLHTD